MIKIILIFLVIIILPLDSVFAHKPINHEGENTSFETALSIPDHTISWVIYETLEPSEARFYVFEAKKGEPFYASIIIPKISGLENYKPILGIVGPKIIDDDNIPFETELGKKRIPYNGKLPGKEFYEPFGQISYWERQEISFEIPSNGKYYIIVYDEEKQKGKYSLAIGTIEDFSFLDFFTVLPKAWFETKLFVNDYSSIVILFLVIISIPSFVILLKRKMSLAKAKQKYA